MALSNLFTRFFRSEQGGGITLIFCTIISLVITNIFGNSYTDFWNQSFGSHTLVQWINDGLMTIFFLLIGLELEREIYIGELSDLKNAMLPVFAALGGMLMPAGIYLLLNWDGPGRVGAGIPMATDIAFAVGVLSMLGNRVPASLKVFLVALAVIDDLGAIIVIAVVYTDTVLILNLAIALGIFGLLLILNRLKVRNLVPYLVGGFFMWYFMLSSGVHATITGVLLAFAIPFGNGDEKSPSYILQGALHFPVAYIILPVFALANTAIFINRESMQLFDSMISIGILAGLLVGKPLGVVLFSYLTTVFKISALPEGMKWSHLMGAGMLAGIGFTMSIFITLLSFEDETMINIAKMSILLASLLAGIIAFFWLKAVLPASQQK
jgi:NhaA family Na+:H+ antiporter